MRRIVSMILSFMIFCTLYSPVHAYEEEQQIDIYVKIERNEEGMYPAPITEGAAETTLEDGTAVSVTGIPEEAVRLMVVPVPETETEAWEWIESCMTEVADPVHTFAIYFEDQDGKRIDAEGAVVTLDCPHCQAVPVVCSLDTDGTVHILTAMSRTRSTAVTFTTDGSSYYVMAEEIQTPDTPDDPDTPDTPDTPDPPQKPEEPFWKQWLKKLFGHWWGDDEEKCEHTYTSVVTKPTCTEKGYTTHTCDKCGESYKDSYTNALGHAYEDGVCTVCGDKQAGCKPGWGSIWKFLFGWWR